MGGLTLHLHLLAPTGHLGGGGGGESGVCLAESHEERHVRAALFSFFNVVFGRFKSLSKPLCQKLLTKNRLRKAARPQRARCAGVGRTGIG
jgi:hypothetical protein